MRRILAGAIVLALASPAASAADWVKTGSTPAGVTLYYDRDTATYNDGHVDAWDRIVFPSAQSIDDGTGAVQYVEMRGHHNIDCLGRIVVHSGARFYDAAGNLVHTMTIDSKPVAITPASSSWAIAKLYCQNW